MSTITPSDRTHLAVAPAFLTLALLLAPTLARADAPAPASAPSSAPSSAPAPAPTDALDPLRERFREGMDKYKSGAFAEAIVIWESIYRDLGSDRGYRLAFDLARAYDQLGDLIRAADHYETYLEKVHARRGEGEQLEPNVERQEEIARERCEKIAGVKARIRVKAASQRPVIARVDGTPPRVAGFVLYVEPGAHVVTFGSGRDAEVRRVTVEKGQLLDVDPREETLAPEPPGAVPVRFETRVDHPFSPTVLWIGAGVAVASLVIPVLTYANALSIKSDYDSPSTTVADKERLKTDYESARTNAYASVVVPALFTAAAGSLALWYVLGAKETRVPLPGISVGPTGAAVEMHARF